ncbi:MULTISPECIES: protein translocase subunit SecD [Streptacidiphilus]|uniref:Protein translocase subunit SecD n=1 Tax=Streptacidiphilus cavernicola TaxID=3342716 RepID=A0ABV6UTE3_9ACTN|nr:protein translocase subunit SecD [Streptacidiphilus jeojiense]
MGLILAVAVALVAIMFATGNTTPRLGVDLAGGTTVTLKAVAPKNNPGAVNSTSMNEAVSILQQRVNGMGVSEATVQTEGSDTIVVTIPKGNNTQQIENEVGTTAKLYFRPVLAEAPSGVTVTSSASASASASGTASASASASTQANAPSGSASASPSATKTQGDAVTGDLTKATATASASATAKASTTPAATGTAAAAAAASSSAAAAASLTTGTVPADLTTQFANLDCSKAAQRVDHQTDTTKDAVACSSDASAGYYIKYALGPVAVPGTDISSASAGISTQNGGWQVNLNFTSSGGSKFTTVTTALAKNTTPANQFAIVLDGKVQSAPSVSSAITGGQAQITGSFTQEEATSLANVLSYGALPLDFSKQDVTTVSPELGSSQLTAGLVSGAIGLALVILYSLLYYRGLGLVAIAGLAVSAVLTYAIMCLLGATIGFALNLPAVCGAIVAIGITADSFVVYFERIRDELRHGSSLRPAVQRAWPKARRTILVADFVSFLAAAVLYFFTVGKVQGFAFTLGLTTLLDVVVIFLFTKPLITLLARRKFFAEGHPMSGLDPKRLGVRPPLRGGRRPAETKEA